MEKLTFGECTVVIHDDAVCRTQEETERILESASRIIYDSGMRMIRQRRLNHNEGD